MGVPDDSDLSCFLRGDSWPHRFEEEILGAARSLVSKVRDLQLEEGDDGTFTLHSPVAGEEPSVQLWPSASGWEMEANCSCEVGPFCHHAAALMLKAARSRDLGRLQGHSIRAAVAASLKPTATPESTPTSLPLISPRPQFTLHVMRQPVDPQTKLILQSLGQADPGVWIFAEAGVVYDGHAFPLRGAMPDWQSEVTLADGRRVRLQHDMAAENQAARLLGDSGLSSLQSNQAWQFLIRLKTRKEQKAVDRWFPDPGRIPVDLFWHQFRGEWIPKLDALGWQVTVDDNVGHRVHAADPTAWKTKLQPRGGGWFDLSVGFDVDGERHDLLPILAELLEAGALEETLDRPDHGFIYAPLPNGDALQLPLGRVRRILLHLSSLIDPKFPERTKLHALDAASLLGQLEGAIEAPADLDTFARKLREFAGIEAVEAPAGLNATLRDYQLAGFRWMHFIARHGLHGILADDMGLGKTLQTLCHILHEKRTGQNQGLPALVVAPTSVVPNWQAEARKFAPELRVLVLNGPERRKYHRSIPHADLVLTSYALLHRDIAALEKHPFHLAILDEAQHIKNPQAKVAQAACRLDARHRLCLSGTPVENHLGELWSLMKFLIPGLLGGEQAFNERYRKKNEQDDPTQRLGDLKQRVAPLILRRTKDQVAKELPPKTELIHRIELHTAQKDLYETVRAMMNKRVRQAIAARGGSDYQIVFLDALLKLRQICCDPRLLPDELSQAITESAKLDFLTELLEVLVEEGRRILIFSQFTTMLGLIEAHLAAKGVAYLKLTGASKDRGALVEKFQSGEVPVFLISLKAGGTGLNLTAADTVIHYDPWWNPAAEAQATDRAYRIGQDKPVFVHKLLCQDTVEERIHRMQQDKAKLAAGLLDGQDISQRLSPDMMQALLD